MNKLENLLTKKLYEKSVQNWSLPSSIQLTCKSFWLRTSRIQICKQWLNQLKNFFCKHFKNIIWHLFAGESHQVVKITVTYYLYYMIRAAPACLLIFVCTDVWGRSGAGELPPVEEEEDEEGGEEGQAHQRHRQPDPQQPAHTRLWSPAGLQC